MLSQLFSLGGNPIITTLTIFLLLMVLGMVISVHEFAHAWMANRLGDPSAKFVGRLTLNPFAHLDPLGTLMILFFGFGWGKPVPIDPRYFKNVRRDTALVALAGPSSNLIMAVLLSLLFRPLIVDAGLIGSFLYLLVRLNITLAIFNLLPIHPLDGFKIVHGFLPERLAYQWDELRRYGLFILLFVIFPLGGSSILGAVIFPIIQALTNFLL